MVTEPWAYDILSGLRSTMLTRKTFFFRLRGYSWLDLPVSWFCGAGHNKFEDFVREQRYIQYVASSGMSCGCSQVCNQIQQYPAGPLDPGIAVGVAFAANRGLEMREEGNYFIGHFLDVCWIERISWE